MDEFIKSAAMLLTILVPLLTGIGMLWKKLDRIWKSINQIDKKKVSHKTCEKRRTQCGLVTKRKLHHAKTS